jgi:hypothetical protein
VFGEIGELFGVDALPEPPELFGGNALPEPPRIGELFGGSAVTAELLTNRSIN